jgi:hypothetical protein
MDVKIVTEHLYPALSGCQTYNEDEKIQYLVQQDPDADEEYTVAEQRKIIHKVDRRLLILLGLMQAASFLDRANIANAAVAGYDIYLCPGEAMKLKCFYAEWKKH